MPVHEIDVAAIDDLDGIHQVEADGQQILLMREGGAVHALAATCPHAGAPLKDGVRHGNRLICPWHKAAFCIRTGAMLDPPTVDNLRRYEARVQNGRILLAMDAPAPPAAAAPPDEKCFVIAGAGAAGAMAAQTLREERFGGRIVMLDQANRVPYDRTILSKYTLSGEKGAEKTPLQSQAWYRQHAIERRTAEIVRIDATARTLFCADGSALAYDAALLATGAAATRPALPGAHLDHVFTLRSRADADAILAQAERSTRAVILGASFIAMEAAASLRERGLEVTVIARDKVPFEKQLGPEIGAVFVALHEKHGVRFRLDTAVAGLEGAGQVSGVRLEGGDVVAADLVVAGFGVKPATGFADGLPRTSDGGIQVDAQLRVAEALYAAGDIASFPYRGDGAPLRVEHWRVAQQHGRVAALNMLGQPARYDAVPVFWTIQYMKRLDYAGHADDWDELVVHGDLTRPQFLAYYCKDGKVAAAAGLDRDRDMAAVIELLSRQRHWRAADLGDDPEALLTSMDARNST